ncbi:hypothetical protein SAMN05660206_10446 [Sphingobacterium wenxiniae]|uniref:Uncharacterized protein n=1 Tax=Sphingobacterium wenxiniae TaxID=683125 RepID=A0A1I6S004_9SPHI|nr:hypothetical protein SAMN05660206_10446 [Sphingobacterium wenxiniae]
MVNNVIFIYHIGIRDLYGQGGGGFNDYYP